MKKRIYYVLFLVGVMALIGCQKKSSVNEEQYLEGNDLETEEIIEQNTEDTLQSQIEWVTHGCQVVQEGETMSLNGINITVNDVNVTRKKGDWYDRASVELDENGEMPEDRMYVVVNVTIEREPENERFWLNSISLACYDNDLRIGLIELYGTSLFKEDNGDPDMYEGVVKPGETLTTDLIYYLRKEEEGEDAHFLLAYSPTGLAFGYSEPEDNCMTYLKSLENVWDKVDSPE